MALLSWYGEDGTWYEDSCVIDMIKDTAALQQDSMDALLWLLQFVHHSLSEYILGQSPSQPIRAVIPSTSSQGSVCCGSSGQTSWKAKCRKLDANWFIDVAAVENDKEEGESNEEEGLEECIHCPQQVGRSGKQSYQQKINVIIERLNRKTPEEATSIKSPKMSQLPKGIALPPQKSIFVVDFFSGTLYKDVYSFVFLHYGFAQPVPEYSPSNLCCWEDSRWRHYPGFLAECMLRLPAPSRSGRTSPLCTSTLTNLLCSYHQKKALWLWHSKLTIHFHAKAGFESKSLHCTRAMLATWRQAMSTILSSLLHLINVHMIFLSTQMKGWSLTLSWREWQISYWNQYPPPLALWSATLAVARSSSMVYLGCVYPSTIWRSSNIHIPMTSSTT